MKMDISKSKEAAIRLKEKIGLAKTKEVIRQFGVNFVSEIPESKQAEFIALCDRLSLSKDFSIHVTDSEGVTSNIEVKGASLASALRAAAARAEQNLDFE